ncbi:cytochrome P450 [Thermoflexus sp.]|uniref:cytochrome P450 n=1 Tax=Thermoflexus sp. TaxID=1969742 RepID=UPI0025E16C0D|nr:cytochrome P450 [Thermoflexus sp.]MCS6964515.1 cytochrome P450 [Thermoflexus sp.]MCX7690741.1 cytochrome P450 [Thermoflexus sp.]MDW8185358.1 cytochrome P450 [Anaerolineae bacterium]
MAGKPPCGYPGARAQWRALRTLIRDRFLLEALSPLREDAGDVFFLSFLWMRVAVVAGPEAARAVLVTHRHLFSSRLAADPVARLMRGGMLVVDGEDHDRARRFAEPFFRPAYLEARAARMQAHIDRWIDAWPDGDVVEMAMAMRRMALEILLEVIFGLPPRVAESMAEPLEAARAYIAPGLWLLFPRLPRPGYRRSLERLDAQVRALIRQRREDPHSDDLLSAWARMPDMSEEDIRDQMITLLIAGHDTVAMWLAWTIALLARHPDVQDRARAEVQEHLGDRAPDPESIRSLAFLRAVGTESMRLFPPIPVLNRRALAPVTLDGVSIPAGTRVLVAIYTIHRHPKLWKDPDRFQPERFLSSSSEWEGTSLRYLPFGAGPRFCIGAPLAKLEGFMALARMLQRVAFEPVPPAPRPRLRATLDPWPGAWVRVRRIAPARFYVPWTGHELRRRNP